MYSPSFVSLQILHKSDTMFQKGEKMKTITLVLLLLIAWIIVPDAEILMAQEIGACCSAEGVCVEMTEEECLAGGRYWMGPGTVCLGDGNENGIDDACEELPGACCFSDGSCQNLSGPECEAESGFWRGPSIECQGDNDGNGKDDACENLFGACCLPNGDCLLRTEDGCSAMDECIWETIPNVWAMETATESMTPARIRRERVAQPEVSVMKQPGRNARGRAVSG